MPNAIVELNSFETASVSGGNPLLIAIGISAAAYAGYKAADEVYKLAKEAITGFVDGVQSEM